MESLYKQIFLCMTKTVFISFAGTVEGQDKDLLARQKLLMQSALDCEDIDCVRSWGREDIVNTQFYFDNKALLDSKRGAGYWAWKPYIILETLKSLKEGDIVIYCDVGKPFRRNDASRGGNAKIGNTMFTSFGPLKKWIQNGQGFFPGIWIPHYGNAGTWTKRDCFVGMGCDSDEFHSSGQVQATFSAWSNTENSLKFLRSWLSFCLVRELVSDDQNKYGKPNLPEFIDHRHDQSILTNLILKQGNEVFGSKKSSLAGFRDMNMAIRHIALQQNSEHIDHVASMLIDQKTLLPNMKLIFSLAVLSQLAPSSNIATTSSSDTQLLASILGNCQLIDRNSQSSSATGTFDLIFANGDHPQRQLREELCRGYQNLAPGGVLYLGPFSGNDKDSPKVEGSFCQLIHWINNKQSFTGVSSMQDYAHRNAITTGNTMNPITFWSKSEKANYILLRKPTLPYKEN